MPSAPLTDPLDRQSGGRFGTGYLVCQVLEEELKRGNLEDMSELTEMLAVCPVHFTDQQDAQGCRIVDYKPLPYNLLTTVQHPSDLISVPLQGHQALQQINHILGHWCVNHMPSELDDLTLFILPTPKTPTGVLAVCQQQARMALSFS